MFVRYQQPLVWLNILLFGWLSSVNFLPVSVAALIASVYVLIIPAGIGLVILSNASKRLREEAASMIQHVLLAWLIGLLLIIYAYIAIERYGLTIQLSLPAFVLLFAVGSLGLAINLPLLKGVWSEINTHRETFFIALIATFVHYIATTLIYSDYPVMDLFQRVHFHEGALAFAKHGILNPLIANSYIPLQQVILGLLAKFANIDLLNAEWILPITIAPIQIGTLYVLFKRLCLTEKQVTLALGLTVSILNVTNLTNAQVSEIASLLLFSYLLPTKSGENQSRAGKVATIFIVVIISVALNFLIHKLSLTTALPVFLGILIVCAYLLRTPLCNLTCVALCAYSTLAFHRGGTLFLALIVMAWWIIRQLKALQPRLSDAILNKLIFIAITVLLAMSGRILLLGDSPPQDEFGLWSFFDYALKPLTGKSIANVNADIDLVQGVGGRIALFELGRTVSLICTVCIGLFFLASFKNRGLNKSPTRLTDYQLFSKGVLFVCLLLMIVTLTGFPFIHRGSYLIIILMTTTLVYFAYPNAGQALFTKSKKPQLLCLIYSALFFICLHCLAGRVENVFLAKVLPILFTLLIASCIVYLLHSRLKRHLETFPLLLVLCVLSETTLLNAYFKKYAFASQMPSANTPLSHFNHQQLKTADKIGHLLTPESVLLSDPKSMALIAARTGNPAIVAFSNINSMSQEGRVSLRELLSKVTAGVDSQKLCSQLVEIADTKSSAQFNYERVNHLIQPRNGQNTLMTLGFDNQLIPRENSEYDLKKLDKLNDLIRVNMINNHHISVAIIISAETYDWLDHPENPSYFPINHDISPEQQKRLSNYKNAQLIDGTFLITLDCRYE